MGHVASKRNGNSLLDTADENTSLTARTIELLNETDLTLPEVFMATGISLYWLRKFKQDAVLYPSANRVQRLYEFLSGHKLNVR